MAVWISALGGWNGGDERGGDGLGNLGGGGRRRDRPLISGRRVLMNDGRRGMRIRCAGLKGWVHVCARRALHHLGMVRGRTIRHHGVRSVWGMHHGSPWITALGLLGGSRRAIHCGEGGANGGYATDIDALTSEEVIEAIDGEARIVALK